MKKTEKIDNAKKETASKEITLKGYELVQLANALEIAVNSCQGMVFQEDLLWWCGCQMGQLRRHMREYSSDINSDSIRRMDRAMKEDKSAFIESNHMDAIAELDTAKNREYIVKIITPDRSMFSDGASATFAKVLSYMEIED